MSERSFHFPEGSLTYAEIQHSGMRSSHRIFEVRSRLEWEVIKDQFSSQTKTVLDLGCGLGRMSVWANWQLGNGAKYYLADRTAMTDNVVGGWPAKEEWYNDLEMTKQFAVKNGLTNCEVIDLARREALLELPRIDVLISIAAVGYHWPIEDWLDILEKLDVGVMIFTVRPGQYRSLPGSLRLIERTPISTLSEDVLITLPR
jgi:hypothetical protein